MQPGTIPWKPFRFDAQLTFRALLFTGPAKANNGTHTIQLGSMPLMVTLGAARSKASLEVAD